MRGGFRPAMSFREAVRTIEVMFQAAGFEEPHLEARCLVADATGRPRHAVGSSEPVGELASRFDDWVARRLAGEPLSRIIGRRQFRHLDLVISPAVLDPRPESEILVDLVLARRAPSFSSPRILDLGTGSGALLLALLAEWPEATGLGVDCSPEALAIARRNAAATGLADRAEFAESNLFSSVTGRYSVVVSNPPYISTRDLAGLDREVRDHDPSLALDGGADGLDFYRRIVEGVGPFMLSGGLIAFEHGSGQAEAVAGLLCEAGFKEIAHHRDYSGHLRHITAISPSGACYEGLLASRAKPG
jgi:release factor glutamine methyltransferase